MTSVEYLSTSLKDSTALSPKARITTYTLRIDISAKKRVAAVDTSNTSLCLITLKVLRENHYKSRELLRHQ
jgi:hypothetical protein